MQLHKFSLRVSSAALLLLATAAPVAASDSSAPSNSATTVTSPQAETPAHAKSEPAEPKKICRTIEQTSSRLQAKKVCLTREQWRRATYN